MAERFESTEAALAAVNTWALERLPGWATERAWLHTMASSSDANEDRAGERVAAASAAVALQAFARESLRSQLTEAAAQLAGKLESHAAWLSQFKRARGRPSGALAAFLEGVLRPHWAASGEPSLTFPPVGDEEVGGSAELDDAVALAVLAGLVAEDDYQPLLHRVKRGELYPTLSELLEVERKRVREALKTLHRKNATNA